VPSQTPPFVLVTGNAGKLAEARRLVGSQLQSIAVDLPEIQSLDMLEILRGKGAEAYGRLQRPLVVEETGLELRALGGFPGPLVKWMLEAVGPEGVARCALAHDDCVATAVCAVLYVDGETSICGEGNDPGSLVLPPRGEAGFGWDPVFVPKGSERTWAEQGDAAKDRGAHRGLAWRDLLSKLAEAGIWQPTASRMS